MSQSTQIIISDRVCMTSISDPFYFIIQVMVKRPPSGYDFTISRLYDAIVLRNSIRYRLLTLFPLNGTTLHLSDIIRIKQDKYENAQLTRTSTHICQQRKTLWPPNLIVILNRL